MTVKVWCWCWCLIRKNVKEEPVKENTEISYNEGDTETPLAEEFKANGNQSLELKMKNGRVKIVK